MEREGYRLGHSLIDYFLSFLVCVSFILEAGCKCGGLMRAQGNDKGPVVYDAKLRVKKKSSAPVGVGQGKNPFR